MLFSVSALCSLWWIGFYELTKMLTHASPRIIVNAIPLLNVATGITRYVRCLYAHLACMLPQERIGYFDGRQARAVPPAGPADLQAWQRNAALFWKLPAPVALAVRLLIQLRREQAFRRCSESFDVYHETGFFPFARAATQPTLYTLYDLSLIDTPEYHPRERVLFNRLFFRKRLALAAHVACISAHTRQLAIERLGLAPERVSVTPLAHDCALFCPLEPAQSQAALAGLPLPEKFLLFVGTGDPRKNFNVIPPALARARTGLPLVVAGWTGWDRAKTTDAIVHCTGYVTDRQLAALYNRATALILPSLDEGFGLPVLEAMACGCPVITTCRGALPEAGGDAARYLPDPTDTDELASLIADIVTNTALRQDLISRGQAHARNFSWDHTARQTLSLLEQISA